MSIDCSGYVEKQREMKRVQILPSISSSPQHATGYFSPPFVSKILISAAKTSCKVVKMHDWMCQNFRNSKEFVWWFWLKWFWTFTSVRGKNVKTTKTASKEICSCSTRRYENLNRFHHLHSEMAILQRFCPSLAASIRTGRNSPWNLLVPNWPKWNPQQQIGPREQWKFHDSGWLV